MRAATWGEFKKAVESKGVVDSTPISRIDYDPDDAFSGLEVFKVSTSGERLEPVIISNEDY